MSVATPTPVHTIRQTIAGAILNELEGDGWQESAVPYDQFGSGEGENALHKSFAVGCPTTTPFGGRQTLAEGVFVDTAVVIKWAYNVSALDQVDSYDAALVFEALIVGAAASSRRDGLQLIVGQMTRPLDDQGWIFGSITLRALHHFSLDVGN